MRATNRKKTPPARVEVVRWLTSEEAESMETAAGGMGGWFGHASEDGGPAITGNDVQHRWPDYLARIPDAWHPYVEAIRRRILAENNRKGGFWHQREGVPLFDDGKVGDFSFRGWGDLQAAIWATAENRHYSYCHFAWTSNCSADTIPMVDPHAG